VPAEEGFGNAQTRKTMNVGTTQLQKELADLTTDAKNLTPRLKANKKRRAELMKELDG
jgi:hypothetical protein